MKLKPYMKKTIDLTNLSVDATESDIWTLCEYAKANHEFIAAVCVFPKWVRYVWDELGTCDINIATVANFPTGKFDLAGVRSQISNSFLDGALEIDLVIDWDYYNKAGSGVTYLIDTVCPLEIKKHRAQILKTILETGELFPYHVYSASMDAMMAGTDFLKTSTGTTETGATIIAVHSILKAIKSYYMNYHRRVGLKISGGIRTGLDAEKFFWLLEQYDMSTWARDGLFRYGVSSRQVIEDWKKECQQ